MRNTEITPDRSKPGMTTTALPTESLDGSEKSATGRKQLKMAGNDNTIGTWNVRTLYATGKVLTHALSRYKWDIAGLAETRWTGEGETSTEEGHKIWYSGEREKHQHGEAFIVRKEITDCVIGCTAVNSRIISIRITAKPINITVIQVYAPTTSHSDDETEMFYETLEETIARTRKKDITIIIGDRNAKIGEDAYEDWAETVGKFGCGNTNNRGLRLQVIQENNMAFS